jgi:hypothetical protein
MNIPRRLIPIGGTRSGKTTYWIRLIEELMYGKVIEATYKEKNVSCADCEKCQETFVDSENEIYIRVGIANVQIIACKVHAKALIDIYRKGLETIQNGTNESRGNSEIGRETSGINPGS